jgi:Arc/MetJ family transcription regulator
MIAAARKVTVNLPADLLADAQRITGLGITPTLVEALEELQRREKRSALRRLRGKVGFELDLEGTRR